MSVVGEPFDGEQVAELVKAPEWADSLVLDWGLGATVARLRKTIRREWFTETSDHVDADRPNDDRDRMTSTVTDDHRWHLHGDLDLDLGRGAVVDAAMTDGWRLPDSVRDRICCDSTVQPVWERGGVPFSVGRTQRVVPERTRRIIERHDRGCRVPGCTNDRFLEVHHIVHWLTGGPTDTANLLTLCPRHHRLHHHGMIGITGNADKPDGVDFTDAHGSPYPPCGRPNPPRGDPPRPPSPYEPPLMGRVDHQWLGLGWIHPDEQHRTTTTRPPAD